MISVHVAYWLLPLLIFGGHANAQTTAVAFGALRVPGKYVNQEQLLVAGSIFDNDDIDQIALVIPDSEVRNFIADYAVEAGSNRVRRIRLSLREIDSAALSNDVLAEFAARQPNSYVREADKYTAYERWYNARSAWVLVNTVDNQTRQIARCQRIEAGEGVDACIFSENIEGYGVQFRLENENIALAYEFKEFIRSKIHEWTGNPPENE